VSRAPRRCATSRRRRAEGRRAYVPTGERTSSADLTLRTNKTFLPFAQTKSHTAYVAAAHMRACHQLTNLTTRHMGQVRNVNMHSPLSVSDRWNRCIARFIARCCRIGLYRIKAVGVGPSDPGPAPTASTSDPARALRHHGDDVPPEEPGLRPRPGTAFNATELAIKRARRGSAVGVFRLWRMGQSRSLQTRTTLVFDKIDFIVGAAP
jgi:hypothetical protein